MFNFTGAYAERKRNRVLQRMGKTGRLCKINQLLCITKLIISTCTLTRDQFFLWSKKLKKEKNDYDKH